MKEFETKEGNERIAKENEAIKHDPKYSTYTLRELQEVYAENAAAEIENRKAYGKLEPFDGKFKQLGDYDVSSLHHAYWFVIGFLLVQYGDAHLIDGTIYYEKGE